MQVVRPPSLARPVGFEHGVIASGRMLFVAGQIGWDASSKLVSADFVAQFQQALANVLEVVRSAGGTEQDIARMTIYVTDKKEYKKRTKDVGAAYRGLMRGHFPAMTLVEVSDLLEDGALVEIEATAVLP